MREWVPSVSKPKGGKRRQLLLSILFRVKDLSLDNTKIHYREITVLNYVHLFVETKEDRDFQRQSPQSF